MDAPRFTLTSPAFTHGEPIPRDHTCDGRDRPPPLEWTNLPEGCRSIALIVDDPDAPRGTFTHWLLWNLVPDQALAKAIDLSTCGTSGVNDFGKLGYRGPCPPAHDDAHRYRFTLCALDAPLDLPRGATRSQLDAAMTGHVLDTAVLLGTYRREIAT